MNLNPGDYYVLTYLSGNKFFVYVRKVSDGIVHASVCCKWTWCRRFYDLTPDKYSQPIALYQSIAKYEPTRLERFFGLVRSKKLFGLSREKEQTNE